MKSFVSKSALIAGLALGVAAGGLANAKVGADAYIAEQHATAILTSSIVGAKVYDGFGDNAEAIGDVNDLMLNADGTVSAVVIGVGGFVGVGEKDVAVDYGQLAFTTSGDGSERIVLEASKEDLEAAPEFHAMKSDMQDGVEKAASDAVDSATKALAMEDGELREIAPSELRASTFVGSRVYTSGDEWVGEVGDVVMDSKGELEAVIIDFGGWLGIGEKEIAVSMDRLSFKTDQDDDMDLWVYVKATKEQLEDAPTYDENGYKNDPESFRLTQR